MEATRTRIANDRLARTASIESYNREVEASDAAAAAAVAHREAALREARARGDRARDRTLDGIDHMGERMDSALVRASERVENMGETLEGVTEDAAGVMTTEDGTPVVVASESEEAALVVARTIEGDGTGEGTATGRASGGARRARERRVTTEAAADADRTETARATAREMVISAFGTEAVRQLGAALGGGGGGRGRARRSEAGGSPESVGG